MPPGPGHELGERHRGRRGLRLRREVPPRLGHGLLGLVHENPGPLRPVGGANLEAHGLLASPEQADPIPAPIDDGVMTGCGGSMDDRVSLIPRVIRSAIGDVFAATALDMFRDTVEPRPLCRSIARPSSQSRVPNLIPTVRAAADEGGRLPGALHPTARRLWQGPALRPPEPA